MIVVESVDVMYLDDFQALERYLYSELPDKVRVLIAQEDQHRDFAGAVPIPHVDMSTEYIGNYCFNRLSIVN
tara:strand:- start:516 stop:731 length:216 start_codon:yes stop_codon:yes gene_type:complete